MSPIRAAVCVILLAGVIHAQGRTPPVGPPEFHPEAPCNRVGGYCIRKTECPSGFLASSMGLCPEQQPMGVECCHSVSINERRCAARGGECMDRCPSKLQIGLAEDCPANTVCCALV